MAGAVLAMLDRKPLMPHMAGTAASAAICLSFYGGKSSSSAAYPCLLAATGESFREHNVVFVSVAVDVLLLVQCCWKACALCAVLTHLSTASLQLEPPRTSWSQATVRSCVLHVLGLRCKHRTPAPCQHPQGRPTTSFRARAACSDKNFQLQGVIVALVPFIPHANSVS